MSEAAERDLAPLLEYLRGLGWEDLYLPAAGRGGGEGEQAAGAPRSSGTPARGGSLRAALAAAREGAAGGSAQAVPRGAPAAQLENAGVPAFVATLAAGIPDDAAARTALLEQVRAEALACTRCGLAAGRRTVVFGTGDPNADLMFVGEGPGAEEDRQGLPFVGPAGQLLTRIIKAIGLTREQVYIANVVKCRPPNNRDPRPDEVAACRPFLEAQIRLVRPKVLVALGRVAGQVLLGADLPVARMRGHWHELLGVPLRVTYHPAAILRDAGLKRPTWEDMQLVRDRLAAAQGSPEA